MKELKVNLGSRAYPIYIGEGLLSSEKLFADIIKTQQVLIISNETVAPLYLEKLQNSLQGVEAHTHIIPDGESYKNLQVFDELITRLLELKFSRNACLIALGGGVVGDLTGFVAASYQRGINFIQVPTTLLAQVDSSVGGKTAVNHELGKNMIGAFHQPLAVVTDTSTLKTLPERELYAGMAEVIKYGLIRDADFNNWIEQNISKLILADSEMLEIAIERSCQNKAEVVAADETEQGQRALLNLGHTFGHAVETALGYKHWLHGEAVGLGMCMAADLSMRMGWIDSDTRKRISDLIRQSKLPVRLPEQVKGTDLRELMSVDKKNRDGNLNLILLRGIGNALVTSGIQEHLLQETIDEFSARAD